MKKLFLFLFLYIFFMQTKSQCLNGSYTVGGTTPNYANFTAAVSALTTNGVCGPVTFYVAPGSYTEQISIGNITGADSANTITFRSANGVDTSVILNYPSSTSTTANYVVSLNASSYIRFRSLTIQRTGSNSFARVIDLAGQSSFILFDSTIIKGKLMGLNGYSVDNILVYSGNSKDSANIFSHSTFINGSAGICFVGPSSANRERRNEIKYNSFLNQSGYGILLYNQDDLSIYKNTFESDSTSFVYVGIYAQCIDDDIFILGNKFNVGNQGILLNHCAPTNWSHEIRFENNMVRSVNEGIYLTYCKYFEILNSSVFNSTPFFETFHSDNGVNCSVKNNIFYNSVGGPVMNLTGNNTISCDYNDIFTAGTVIGTYNGTNSNGNLSSWQTVSTLDQHSVSTIPPFVSAADLHIVYDNKLKGMGYGVFVYFDFDNDFRNNPPDIGADEFNLPVTDAGVEQIDSVCSANCSGNLAVYISIKNLGSSILNTAQLNWSVNGVLQAPLIYNTPISSLQQNNMINIGTFNFIRDTLYTIKCWTSLPNNLADMGPLNDTAFYTYKPTALAGVFTVGGVSPDYTTIQIALTDLYTRGVCAPVILNLRNGNHFVTNFFMNNIPGTSSVNSITVQSESGDSSAVVLHGPTIMGSHYRFGHVSFVPDPFNGSGQNLIETYGNDIIFSNCELHGVSGLNVNDIFVVHGTGNSYFNNYLHNASGALGNTNNQPDFIIKGNVLKQLYSGIGMTYLSGYAVVDDNKIDILSAQQNMAIHIEFDGGTAPIVTKNIITATNSIWRGIELDGTGDTSVSNRALIANNFISYGFSGGNETGITSFLGHIDVYFNSVSLTSVAGFGANTTAIQLLGNNTNCMNNICSNSGGGGIAAEFTNQVFSDYNDYYSNGTVLIVNAGNNYSNIAAYNTMRPSCDIHSISSAPNFTAIHDLHIVSNSVLGNAGMSIAGIITDIDNQLRDSLFPDIGADEFQFGVTTGNNQISYSNGNLLVYPNPTKGTINVVADTVREMKKFVLTDMNGRILKSFLINETSNLDIREFEAGVYFLQNENSFCKIVKIE